MYYHYAPAADCWAINKITVVCEYVSSAPMTQVHGDVNFSLEWEYSHLFKILISP